MTFKIEKQSRAKEFDLNLTSWWHLQVWATHTHRRKSVFWTPDPPGWISCEGSCSGHKA